MLVDGRYRLYIQIEERTVLWRRRQSGAPTGNGKLDVLGHLIVGDVFWLVDGDDIAVIAHGWDSPVYAAWL